MKGFLALVLIFLFSCLFIFWPRPARADELEELGKKIQELQRAREMSVNATKPLQGSLNTLNAEIAALENRLDAIEADLLKKQNFIKKAELDLAVKQEKLETLVRQLYKQTYNLSLIPYSIFLGKDLNAGVLFNTYQQTLVDKDKREIIALALFITNLEKKKLALQTDFVRLGELRVQTDGEAEFFRKEIKGAQAYQSQLSIEIASLTARQQQLLAEKTGVFMTGVGEVPLADDPVSRPDYDPGFRPAFAAFSFGAPHRKGMSQYGAFGRAKDGQNYQDILRHYYGDIRLETLDMPGSIQTALGTRAFEEDYLKGIAEMPAKWGDQGGFEALKAQAVAARTYALSYVGWRLSSKNAGGAICVTEACQVYNPARTNNPEAANWHRAVAETRGQVLVGNQSQEIFASWYASTSGGYTNGYSSLGHNIPSSWDTACANQSCWTGQAFEKKADSPWFYKAWYKPRGNSGSRPHPWLSSNEFVDIVNASLLYLADGGALTRLSQTDKANPDTWDASEVRSQLQSRGVSPINDVSGVDIAYSTAGSTSQVNFSTDQGSKSLPGEIFRQIFNLRAPGEIYIPSSLFNIERK